MFKCPGEIGDADVVRWIAYVVRWMTRWMTLEVEIAGWLSEKFGDTEY